jgi:hypothetical protein
MRGVKILSLSCASASVDNIRLWSVSAALPPRWSRRLCPGACPAPAAMEAISHSKDGFTVRAFNSASRNFLALFEPMSPTEPVSMWSRQEKWQWRDVAIHPDDNADRGIVSEVLSNGQRYSWIFFKTLEALTKFAEENIPR